MSEATPNLVCLAHLNWNHVWQRPQQLMTRLTRQYNVRYVDPPQLVAGLAGSEIHDTGVDHGVQVLQPRFPESAAALSDGYWQTWYDLLPVLLQQTKADILWVSSPYADQLVARAKPFVDVVVYDCMDDLASFKDGNAEMRVREANLFASVDLVFTGGHSMYQARKDKHARVHCFPSGVDVAHYQHGSDAATAVPDLPHPQLGYFGVLDERIDWALIAEVAARQPAWHWVLVGPTAKVDPATLPKAANIHYLGQQPYANLPAFLEHFDVATMPFALNEATRFISPTKTLEYLAGGKPVISSSVPDVVAFYHDIVAIADGADAWITAIEQLLQASPADLADRVQRAQPVLRANTWDAIAARMAALVDEQRSRQAIAN